MLGVEDPYLGMRTEDVLIAQRSALESLLIRGILRTDTEDRIEFQDQITTIANTLHHPNHSLIVHSRGIDDQEFRSYIHFGQESIVKHTPLQDQHQLIMLPTVEDVPDGLDQALRSMSTAESSGLPFSLSENILFEARRLCAAGDLDEVKDCLVDKHLSSEAIDPLINTLIRPVATSSFVLVANRNNIESQYVRGFSVLEGREEMWIMEPYEEEGISMVTFQAANATKVRERFFELIPWRTDG